MGMMQVSLLLVFWGVLTQQLIVYTKTATSGSDLVVSAFAAPPPQRNSNNNSARRQERQIREQPQPAEEEEQQQRLTTTATTRRQHVLQQIVAMIMGRTTSAAAVVAAAEDTANSAQMIIPQEMIDRHEVIYATVARIIDGDTIRIQYAHNSTLQNTTTSIPIRLYGIDCPETAKQHHEGQAFANEARQYTATACRKHNNNDSLLRITLLSRDKYQRIVAMVETPPMMEDLSMQLVSHGLADIYRGGGAQYNGNRERLELALKEAQANRIGIWSLSEVEYISPAEYKRKLKVSAAASKKST